MCNELTNNDSVCWLFVTDQPKSWTQALQDCISRGGHLMVEPPNDLDLRQRVSAELVNYPEHPSWWIGLKNTLLDYWSWGGEARVSE